VAAQAPQSPATEPQVTTPGCFSVFLQATGEAWLFPSANLSTAFSTGGYAAIPAWSLSAWRYSAIRGAFGNFRVPAQFAAQAAKYARLGAFLEKAAPVLQVASLISAELEGLQAEWAAASSGACQGVF